MHRLSPPCFALPGRLSERGSLESGEAIRPGYFAAPSPQAPSLLQPRLCARAAPGRSRSFERFIFFSAWSRPAALSFRHRCHKPRRCVLAPLRAIVETSRPVSQSRHYISAAVTPRRPRLCWRRRVSPCGSALPGGTRPRCAMRPMADADPGQRAAAPRSLERAHGAALVWGTSGAAMPAVVRPRPCCPRLLLAQWRARWRWTRSADAWRPWGVGGVMGQ